MVKERLRSVYVFVAILLGAAVGGGGVTMLSQVSHRISFADDTDRDAANRGKAKAYELSMAFQQAAKDVRPSVVSVNSVKRMKPIARRQFRSNAPELPDEFRRFFGNDPFDSFSQPSPDQGLEQQGLGSGVIVSADGFVLTNNHVVDGADELKVTLHDRREFEAKVVGRDKDSDLAVLKIEASGLTPARFGSSDRLEVGEWVLAIGSPMSLQQTVTAGIISATGRFVGITAQGYEDFIQTDAAINPGNSGGPLVNLQGEVIGINTAIASRTGGFMGIGFAIPSSMAQSVMDQIVESGRVTRGKIGAVVSDVSNELADQFGYKSNSGAFIQDVLPDSPAAKSGLKPGDIVTKYKGTPVKSSNQFRNAVAATRPGTKAEVELSRDGTTKTVNVEIAERETDELVSTESGREVESTNKLGLSVQTISPDLARQLKSKEVKGVVVTEVEPGSPAHRAGFKAGDIVVSVDRKEVQTAGEFNGELDKHSVEKGVLLQVRRDGINRFVVIRAH